MRWQEYIECNSTTMAGKPVIRGTRITVELILQRLGQGWQPADLLESFPHLRPEHIQAAQAYAAAALASDEILFLTDDAA